MVPLSHFLKMSIISSSYLPSHHKLVKNMLGILNKSFVKYISIQATNEYIFVCICHIWPNQYQNRNHDEYLYLKTHKPASKRNTLLVHTHTHTHTYITEIHIINIHIYTILSARPTLHASMCHMSDEPMLCKVPSPWFWSDSVNVKQ